MLLALFFFLIIALANFPQIIEFVENAIGILIGIMLNLQITLGSMDILAILILLIHEHKIYFHLYVSSLSFISVL